MGSLITGGLGKKRSLAPRWRVLYRAAKAAKRKGFTKAAEELGMQAFAMKANTPNIITQEYRQAEEALQNRIARDEARNSALLNKLYGMYTRGGGGWRPPEGGEPPMWRGPHRPEYYGRQRPQ